MPRSNLASRAALLPAALLLLSSAAADRRAPRAPLPPLTELAPIASPAAPGSGEPSLAVSPEGTVWMSWLEPRGEHAKALRAARLDHGRWAAPVTIAEGESLFANWADFPSLIARDARHLVACYLQRTGGEPYAYAVRLTRSDDGGATWSDPVVPHRDGTPTEHGFVSLFGADQGTAAVWLDGRKAARDSAGHWLTVPEGMAEMTLRVAVMAADGALGDERELDPRVCDCCQTAAVATPGGALVAFRDRSAEEIRDISLVRLAEGRWSAPYPLHEDGWKIRGCPVNGPSLAALGDRVVAAWFTGAQDTSRVRVAFSSDGGASFGPPVRVDEGDPLGRVQVVALEGGDALVCWLEQRGKEALVQVRQVGARGAPGPVVTVARTAASRAAGLPRMAKSGDRLVLAWTEPGTPAALRTAVARLAPAMFDAR